MNQELSPRPFFNFGKEPKIAIACKKFFQKKIFLKNNCQKAREKLTLVFLLNPVHFNGQDYEKQKGYGTGDQSLFRL